MTPEELLKAEQEAHQLTKDALIAEQKAHASTKEALVAEQDAHTATKEDLDTANTTVTQLGEQVELVSKTVTPQGGVIVECNKKKYSVTAGKFTLGKVKYIAEDLLTKPEVVKELIRKGSGILVEIVK